MIKTLTLLLTATAALYSQAPTPPPQAAGYSLVFYDDFDNLNLSPDGHAQYIWYPGYFWERPPAKPFNASVNASVLNLAWIQGQSLPDTTISSCSSNGKHCTTFRYGYFEARMKWDVAVGAWPAFLLLPQQATWGSHDNGELDIFEGQAMKYNKHWFHGTIHEQVTSPDGSHTTDAPNNSCCNHVPIPGVDFSQWHTYGALWVPGKVTWYFDNQPVLSAATYPVFDTQNYYLVFDIKLGPDWNLGSTNGVSVTSLNLYVDWVKVWQQR